MEIYGNGRISSDSIKQTQKEKNPEMEPKYVGPSA